VVTASSSVEYAFEGAELASDTQVAPSVFTGSVVAGLESGEADRDGDGWVGLNELFGYVAERVRRVTPHQTPHLWAFGSEGDLLLAHSRRRRVTAAELPAEVVEAIGSSLAATRLGVAVELRDRLLGPDLGQALAAWSALTGLASDDSRRVSATAEEAVRAADLQVTPDVVDLGVLPPGSRQVVDLRLTGPPLALVASAVATEEWLSGEVDDGGLLHVAVAPPAAGSYQGTLMVSSPTGEHTVSVRLEVVPGAPEPAPAVVPPARPVTERERPPAIPVDPPAAAAQSAPAAATRTSRRAWLSVPAAQLVACAVLGFAYVTIDRLWYLPNSSNLGTYSLDGVRCVDHRPRGGRGRRAHPAEAGRPRDLGRRRDRTVLPRVGVLRAGQRLDEQRPGLPRRLAGLPVLGLAVAVLTVVDLARRRMLEGPVDWHRPAWRRTALLGVGTALAVAAVAGGHRQPSSLDLHRRPGRRAPLRGGDADLVAVTAPDDSYRAGLASPRWAYLSASVLAALYLALGRIVGRSAQATAVGDVCLLIGVILTVRRPAGDQ
jgi:hypothetical protein